MVMDQGWAEVQTWGISTPFSEMYSKSIAMLATKGLRFSTIVSVEYKLRADAEKYTLILIEVYDLAIVVGAA